MSDFKLDIPVCEVDRAVYPIGEGRLWMSRPPHEVLIEAFAIGTTTVTNAQFLPFIEAGGYTNKDYWTPRGWKWRQGDRATAPAFLHDERYNQPDQPIVGVAWYTAVAYTRWLSDVTGGSWRLPTEAEWEAAARGEFGDAPKPRNYNTAERGIGHAWAVTEAGNTSWCGATDMCGNVWEWCSSRWGKNWQRCDYMYPYDVDDGRENLQDSYARVMRGGSWFDPLPEADPANRGRYLPGSRGSNIGFRLARDNS